MSGIRKSVLLCEIFNDAMDIEQKKYKNPTAEMLIIAAIDRINKNETYGNRAELLSLKLLFNNFFRDNDKLRTIMSDYVNNGKGSIIHDELYIANKIAEAEKQYSSTISGELRPNTLFLAIFNDPTDTVKKAKDICGREQKSVFDDEDFQEAYKKAAEQVFQNSVKHEEENNKKNSANKSEESSEVIEDDVEELFDDIEDWMTEEEWFSAEFTKENPIEEIAKAVADVKRIRSELLSEVFGQDNAINTFTSGYFQYRLSSILGNKSQRPSATFLFAGPPGVGKTFLAESIAKSLALPFMRFDMSEYSDKEANLEFCGSDKVYKNGKEGNVTGFVAKNPNCVLLFDEIEKAHLCIIHLFLQMLDAGRLRDSFTDKEVSFTDAVIILTTNAGKQLYEETEDLSGISRKVIMNALENDVVPGTKEPFFPKAICSRFASGNVAMFNHISAQSLLTIAKSQIEKNCKKIEESTNIKIDVDKEVYTALLFAEGASADARTIRSRAETFFNNELYELLRFVDSEKNKYEITNLKKIYISADIGKADEEIKSLFNSESDANILVFADENTVATYRGVMESANIIGVNDKSAAIEMLKKKEIDFTLIDIKCGAKADEEKILNIEDIDSPARDFFKFLREQKKDLPIYIIEREGDELSDEEVISFIRQGVREVLSLNKKPDIVGLQLNSIAQALHQQKCMNSLAKSNRVISFETLQTVSENGEEAQIRLFDLKSITAVKAEDTKNVLSNVSKPNVKFEQVIGAEDAKTELSYFVEYLKNPQKYMGTGLKAPRGVLLYGPPGTGKTMLAKAMACESGVTFIATEGNQFLKRYVGEGPAYVHKLFKTARQYAPAVLFVDEIETIAKERRGADINGGGGEETLTAFLTEMDGFSNDPTRPVFVLAATNFDVEPGSNKSLDPALMRRFDRTIYVDLPDKQDRIKYLKLRRQSSIALDISDEIIDNIAMRSTGMSLALLDSVIELSLRTAVRQGISKVTDSVFEEAFETFNSGEVKKWDESQLQRVARHEAGHAFMCWYGGTTPAYLTVVARGKHGGYMQKEIKEDKAIYTKEELLANVRTALGGRAAELVYYGEKDGLSTGASGDLVSATRTVQDIVCSFGMDSDYGIAVYEQTAYMSDEAKAAVNRVLSQQLSETVRIISENKDKIDALVEKLMEKNRMTGTEIEAVIGKPQ
ncbi:MAG: AAA family ATPase [Acutalibacteraceae bacterium]|nr:AAA family ATPase [Acutalibacteraceae bacterium]